jgi:biotin carboxylase
MRILINGIGGPTPRSIAKTIRKNFPEAYIVGTDMNQKAIGFFMEGLLDNNYLVPRISDPDYWKIVQDIIEKEKIDFAFIQPEREIIGWGEYFEKNGSFPCPVLIPQKDLALTLMDKSLMADILEGTDFIPKTIKISQENPRFEEVEREIGFPCWIRATQGSGGLGSLKLEDMSSFKSWLFINREIEHFTVSEFLTGRHLATQQLYIDGEYVKGASLECAEYVMAAIAPSKVTGNTSFGRLLNEDRILEFCHSCVEYVCEKLNTKPHGVLSFDLKEDAEGNMKVTEVNIRHMAYTGVMSDAGFDLTGDTILYLQGRGNEIQRTPYFQYAKNYSFLRDVDIEPIIVDSHFL